MPVEVSGLELDYQEFNWRLPARGFGRSGLGLRAGRGRDRVRARGQKPLRSLHLAG